MPAFICTACGTQYPPSDTPPKQCVICEEERQYVPPAGQGWTTLERLHVDRQTAFRLYEPGVFGLGPQPNFGIGQRAILVQTPNGNVLWDCTAFIDDATVEIIEALGGIKAIAISHPHFYTTHAEWTKRFGCKVYMHAADAKWVMRPDVNIVHWEGDTHSLLPGVTLIRCGGHFPGGTVLHWAGGAEGKGIVCAGDVLSVTTDNKFVSFMRSYPNFIPLSGREVVHIQRAMQPFSFERIYGHYMDRAIRQNGKAVLDASVTRYIAALNGTARAEGE